MDGYLMKSVAEQLKVCEPFDLMVYDGNTCFHMALIRHLWPKENGYLEVAVIENGRVTKIVGKSSTRPLAQFDVEEALVWFDVVRKAYLSVAEIDPSRDC